MSRASLNALDHAGRGIDLKVYQGQAEGQIVSVVMDEQEETRLPSTKLNRIAKRWKGRNSVRQYSDEEIGTALAVLDHYSGNALRTSRELGIPRTTILRWIEREGALSPACVNVRLRKREEFAQLSDEAAEWIITSITPKDIRGASLYQKATSYGIFRDKSAIDRGEATAIVGHTEVKQTAEQALNTLYELAKVEAEKRGQSVTLDQVRAHLCKQRPEFKPLLLPESVP